MQFDELSQLHALPFFDLIQRSRKVHEANWPENEVQLCTLLSIKTGGCSEDCSYCAQSARYSTGVAAERLMEKDDHPPAHVWIGDSRCAGAGAVIASRQC